MPQAPKLCRVKIHGKQDGVVHEIDVQAHSLFEGVARGLKALQMEDWSSDDAFWIGNVEVAVSSPAVVHQVSLKKFNEWVNRKGGSSPREVSQRDLVRQILDRKG